MAYLARIWFRLADEAVYRWAIEQLEFAVRQRRRMWGRLGNLLSRHRWAKEFRTKYFRPIWEKKTVKRWERLSR